MSKGKIPYVSSSIKNGGLRQNEANLKERVKELEAEVASLKKRLDELRKAKNTTVLKKEKEYVTSRKYQRNSTDATSGDNEKAARVQENHAAELKKIKETHSTEIERIKEEHKKLLDSQKKSVPACDHEPKLNELSNKIERLEEENATLTSTNGDLQAENIDLRSKFEELFTELSLKEAQWCEKEEQLNLKLKLHWGEKYREWMEATEKKIADLQKANDLLRSYMRPPSEDR